MDIAAINRDIQEHSKRLKSLKLENAEPALIDSASQQLAGLRKQLAASNGTHRSNEESKKKDRLLLKTAKGTRDYGPGEMYCRDYIERIVKDCFASYGGSCLDTPVFERKEILAGKYGEDAKLIYDLMDQGGEQLSLRYDHTVPLARYLAMTGSSNTASKLWQVGKVYRRDNPVMSKGRMREFSQADFDIIGTWDPMVPDAEIISLVCTILLRLDVGDFTIKLNNRKILDGIFETCGVPPEKIRSISSAVDKLDKVPWLDVRKEMVEDKGLLPDTADKIGEYVRLKGGADLLEHLKGDSNLSVSPRATEGISEMETLFDLLEAYDILPKISFDMSLARGLDYYTGVIYEAVVEASAPPAFQPDLNTAEIQKTGERFSKSRVGAGADGEEDIDESKVGVGSIAAGGRYDNLVAMFAAAASGENKKRPQLTPCVGISIGMDRIFSILWPKWSNLGMRSKETMVYVMAAGNGLLKERIRLVRELREAGIKADFLAKRKPKIQTQFEAGERDEVPFAIILGSDELSAGLVTVKEQKWEMVDGKKQKIQSTGKGTPVGRTELIKWLKDSEVLKTWSTGRLIA